MPHGRDVETAADAQSLRDMGEAIAAALSLDESILVLRGVFSPGECEAYRQRMVDLETGVQTLEGFAIAKNYRRSFNQHLYDPA